HYARRAKSRGKGIRLPPIVCAVRDKNERANDEQRRARHVESPLSRMKSVYIVEPADALHRRCCVRGTKKGNPMIRHALGVAGLSLAVGMFALGAQAADDPVATAQANLDKYTAIPEFIAAGPAFDAKTCMAGKKILSIPGSS